MERENFLYKITGDFGFNTGDNDIGIITQKLGIEPTWFFNKNEEYPSKRLYRGKIQSIVSFRPYGIWGYDAKPIFIDVTDISPMIQYFRELLSDKIEIIKELINDYKFECSISITIYTEEKGACGTSVDKNDLLFLSNFSRFDISYLQVENVENI